MADYNFKVEVSKLLSTAAQFEGHANAVNNTISQMLQTVNATGCQWAGQAADNYRKRFAQHDQDRQDIHSLITEHIADLRQIAQTYTEADQSIAGNANTLRVDVVH